jgi:hypothetical protein
MGGFEHELVGGAYPSPDYRSLMIADEEARENPMGEPMPVRLTDEGRTATWNPALTRARHVLLHVLSGNGAEEIRRTMNSGRARVRDGERIERVVAAEE